MPVHSPEGLLVTKGYQGYWGYKTHIRTSLMEHNQHTAPQDRAKKKSDRDRETERQRDRERQRDALYLGGLQAL